MDTSRPHSRVEELMDNIVSLDIEPSVFRVVVSRADHTVGFEAIATFRSDTVKEFVTKGFTPEVALGELQIRLLTDFGVCRYCGRKGKKEKEICDG